MDINIWKVSQSPRFFNDQENEDLFKRNCVCVHPDTNAKGASSTTQGEDFSNVKKGDFFYLCYGNKCIRLFGMFTGESQECKLAGKSDWLEQKYELYFESRSNDKYQGSPAWWTPSDNSTFTRCKNNEEFQEWILKPFFSKTLKDIEMMTNNEEYLCLLKNNNNLILTGAPGTGKTYLAKQIAAQMILDGNEDEETKKNKMNEQCGFVQFHPSYDYTDFVEGLRPKADDGNIGFERKDGVFKAFCEKALKNLLDANKTDKQLQIELSWDKKVITFLNDSIEKQLKFSLTNGGSVMIENYHDDIVYIALPHNASHKSDTIHISKLLKILNAEQTFDKAIEVELYLADYHSAEYSYLLAIYKAIKEYPFNPSELTSEIPEKIEKKNFVFIIDEINRGEISKIFGELFFSIDPGYRGTDGIVKSQYQNLVPKNNVFADGFYVPENVFIIGTMNDIDRSVESMDFAFRRRFAFREITAKDSIQMLDSEDAWGKDENDNSRKPDQAVIEAIKSKMNAINNMIWHKTKDGEKEEEKCIEGFSSAYHIGASYFLKLVNYKNDDGSYDYDQLWNNHLEGLLREYLRGMQNVDEKMKKLKAAYDNESNSNN